MNDLIMPLMFQGKILQQQGLFMMITVQYTISEVRIKRLL